jgi:hypothetical protein
VWVEGFDYGLQLFLFYGLLKTGISCFFQYRNIDWMTKWCFVRKFVYIENDDYGNDDKNIPGNAYGRCD